MKKVAVLTDFMNFPSQYALVPVVLAQLRMLKRFGYDPTLFTMEGAEYEKDASSVPEGVKIAPKVPFMHLHEYRDGEPEQAYDVSPIGERHGESVHTNLKKQEKLIFSCLEPDLSRFDVVITHDILYQTWKIPFNLAVRDIGAAHPEIKWIHWCHSAPSIRPQKIEYPTTLRYSPMANSTYVTFNDSMRPGFAKQYNVPISQVKVVYHYIDEKDFHGYDDISIRLIEKHDLYNCAILGVYPVRFDHPDEKGIPEAVKLFGAFNKFCNAKLLFLNSWSSRKEDTITSLRKLASEWALPQENLAFSSELGKQYENGVPRKVVNDMLDVGNFFVMPSHSESFSLILAEAMMKKNYICVNRNLKPVVETSGGIGFEFPWTSDWGGTLTTEKYAPSEEQFYSDRAGEMWREISGNRVLAAHRNALSRFTAKSVFENQLKPLIEG